MKLMDIFAGAFGEAPDRNALNMEVAEAQQRNAYMNAQTQDAFERAGLARAQALRAQTENQAAQNMQESLVKAGYPPEFAQAAVNNWAGSGYNGATLMSSLSGFEAERRRQAIENPDTSDNQRLLTADALSGHVQSPLSAVGGSTVDLRALPLPGLPPTAMTPMQQAQLADTQSQTKQRAAGAAPAAIPGGQDAVTQGAIQYYLTGQVPNLGYGQAGSALRAQSLAMANQWLRGGVPTDVQPLLHQFGQNVLGWHTAQGAVGMMSHGPNLASVTAADTFANHLQLMPQVVNAIQNGNIQTLNHFANLFQTQTGSSATAVAQALSNKLVAEATAALYPNGSAESDRQKLSNDLNLTRMSADQAQSVGSLYTQLVGAKTQVIEDQYTGSLEAAGVPEAQARDLFRNRLSPTSRQAFGMPLSTDAPPPAAGGAPGVSAPGPQPAAPGSGNPPRLTTTPPGTPGGTPGAAAPSPPSIDDLVNKYGAPQALNTPQAPSALPAGNPTAVPLAAQPPTGVPPSGLPPQLADAWRMSQVTGIPVQQLAQVTPNPNLSSLV